MRLPKVLKRSVLSAFRLLSQISLALSDREFRYVFILAHPRSGSSLLTHILTSHPEFVGAGESNVPYRTPADLPMLLLRTRWLLRQPVLNCTYVVDKINHDAKLTEEVLRSKLLSKCVILIRAPESALKSMMNLFGWGEKDALDAYVSRLETLAWYGTLLRERAILIEYDDLVERSEETLATLTRFFGVETPFTSNYKTHRATGRFRAGDPSTNIRTGHIIRTKGHDYTIGADTLTAASLAFRKCREQLLGTVVRTGQPVALRPAGLNAAS